MKHNISEAAKLAGISRSYLYKKYIKTGIISVERDSDDNPVIDTAEIMRVFGGVNNSEDKGRKDTLENTVKIESLQAENQLLREQLAVAQDREKWMQGKIDQLADQLKLIEHKSETPQHKPGFFARLFGGK